MIRFSLYFYIFYIVFFNDNKIVWIKDEKLNWSHFKGEAPEEKGLKTAVTSVQIKIEGDVYADEIPNVQIVAYFIKNKSWAVVYDKETLDHEQLHFDIAELYARKIRKRFNMLIKEKCSDFKVYTSIYYEKMKEHSICQRDYDSESYSSKIKQQEWQLKVAKELEELKEYEYIPEE